MSKRRDNIKRNKRMIAFKRANPQTCPNCDRLTAWGHYVPGADVWTCDVGAPA